MTEMISKERYSVLLQRERQIADELQRYFLNFAGTRADTPELRQVIASLDDPFLLVVVGGIVQARSNQ